MKRKYSLTGIEIAHQRLQDAHAEMEMMNILGGEMSDKKALQQEIYALERQYNNMLKHQIKKIVKSGK